MSSKFQAPRGTHDVLPRDHLWWRVIRTIEEQCAQYAECARLAPFVSAHKAVFDVEYTTSLGFCGSLPSGVAGLAKHLSLDWWVRWCAATGG